VSDKLSPRDFATSQEVRWCPGCGDYAILKAVQKVLADVGADPSNTAFVSGIGCAARFPYSTASPKASTHRRLALVRLRHRVPEALWIHQSLLDSS